MAILFIDTLSQVRTGTWLTLGIGVSLIILGGYYLYLELRAILTDEASPATFADDPEVLSAGRRTMAWIFIVFSLLGGLAFLYMAYVSIYTCVIANRPGISC